MAKVHDEYIVIRRIFDSKVPIPQKLCVYLGNVSHSISIYSALMKIMCAIEIEFHTRPKKGHAI